MCAYPEFVFFPGGVVSRIFREGGFSSLGGWSGEVFRGRFKGEISGGALGEVSGGGPRRRSQEEFFLINTMLLFIFQLMTSF